MVSALVLYAITFICACAAVRKVSRFADAGTETFTNMTSLTKEVKTNSLPVLMGWTDSLQHQVSDVIFKQGKIAEKAAEDFHKLCYAGTAALVALGAYLKWLIHRKTKGGERD